MSDNQPATWRPHIAYVLPLALALASGWLTARNELTTVRAQAEAVPRAAAREVDSLERRVAALEQRCRP